MEEDLIFGSDIKLPTLPGLQSSCEEELQLLMREVELSFKKRNQDLLKESKNYKQLCMTQKDEIENLRVSFLDSERENNYLKKENINLHQKMKKEEDDKIELQNFKSCNDILKDENRLLREKLSKMEKQHLALESSYKELLNALMGFKRDQIDQGQYQKNLTLEPSLLEEQIDSEVQKFISEESEQEHNLMSDIRQDIDHFKSKLLVGTYEP